MEATLVFENTPRNDEVKLQVVQSIDALNGHEKTQTETVGDTAVTGSVTQNVQSTPIIGENHRGMEFSAELQCPLSETSAANSDNRLVFTAKSTIDNSIVASLGGKEATRDLLSSVLSSISAMYSEIVNEEIRQARDFSRQKDAAVNDCTCFTGSESKSVAILI